MHRMTFVLVLLTLVGLASAAYAHPSAVGKTTFHDGVDKGCTLADGNAAPFAAPSPKHPWGTVITGCFRQTKPGYKTVAVVREWDLFHGRAVREATFPADNGADSLRVAVAGGRILMVVSAAMNITIDHVMVHLLDKNLALVKQWDLGVGGYADIDAEGKLGAVIVDGWNNSIVDIRGEALELCTVDMARGRLDGKRIFRYKKPGWPLLYHAAGSVRVRHGKVLVVYTEASRTKAYRMSKDLRITGGYVRAYKDSMHSTAEAFMALGVHRVLIEYGDRVDVLRPYLQLDRRLAAPRATGRIGFARWAIDRATGRVATENGRVAARVGAPFKRFVDFTHELVFRGAKIGIYADRTTAVLWAFGRVVIVRSAPGLGILAFDPGSPASPRHKK